MVLKEILEIGYKGSVFIQPVTPSVIVVNSVINLGLWMNEM